MTRSRILIFVALAACVLFGVLQAYTSAKAHYLGRAQDASNSTLLLVAEAVDQAVGRFAPIPVLVAGEPVLLRVLRGDNSPGVTPFINEKLRQIAISIGASEIYVIDNSGLTVATSNYRDEDSFLGRNFSFRPYFLQAIEGKTAFFHALGTTSGERGFFFSAPILDGIEVVGVLAIKMTVGAIEQDWLGTGHEILIADENGIVFLTSRKDFMFRTLAPLTEGIRERISETQQFPLDRIVPIGLSADVVKPGTVQVTIGEDVDAERYLANSMPLETPGWHAVVFSPLHPVQNQVIRAMALGGLALASIVLAVLVLVQRRAHILQRVQTEQEQRILLEEKVQERTMELDTTNVKLRQEVMERRNAEERLHKSQKELIQAGKLAALGQMSAAVSHEINQPLAAIKSYADNATEFLARSRVEDAGDNIKRISEMSDRMAEISRHLRTFARQPGDTLKPVNVSEVISETIGLVGPQLRASEARIDFTPEEGVWVLGGKLRLQQVLVNIITNALEAMGHLPTPVIEIEISQGTDSVSISLRDHGPGMADDSIEQVFDAFYTTKEAGSGMGLGMSISHNIISDFGGALTTANHPDGGAIFTVTLQSHEGPHGKAAQ